MYNKMHWEIFDKKIEKITGRLTKVFTSFDKEYLSNGGHWILEFPIDSSWKDKTLLLAATEMIDKYYYDRNYFTTKCNSRCGMITANMTI